jgi:hypothetical protein
MQNNTIFQDDMMQVTIKKSQGKIFTVYIAFVCVCVCVCINCPG